jgi:hypothetical protein
MSLSDDWLRLSPAERRAGLETIRQVTAEQGETQLSAGIAIADAQLPNGVAALLVQDPRSPSRNLLVLSRTRPLDQALVAGLTAFVARRPSDSTIGSTARIAGVEEVSAAPHAAWTVESRRSEFSGALAQRLFRYATSISVIEIPGIGQATLYQFD